MGKIGWGKERKTPLIEGLTLVEVMVGMLISAICLGTALQAYIGAVSIRAKSQQLNTAIARMEADAESIRQMSKEMKDCNGNYVQALMRKVVEEDTASTRSQSADLQSAHSQSTQSSQKSDSLASEEPDSSTPQSFIFPSSPDLPQDQQLMRKMEFATDAPNVLKVSYTLSRPSISVSERTMEPAALAEKGSEAAGRTTLAQLSLAVMPSAALLCP
jgi:Tfp pilus assembly protein PilE